MAEEDKREKLRQLIIEELIQTERDYAADLGVLFKMYSVPLIPQNKDKSKNLLSAEEHSHLFSNLGELLDITYSLLNTLEQRKRKIKGAAGRYQVGDVFLRMAEEFKAYTVYCINHPTALATLEKLRKDSGFLAFEKKQSVSPETKRIGLTGFLIKPVQRICKYPLLLQQLMRHTPENHPEYQDISLSQQKINEVVDYINTRQDIAENIKKLEFLQDSIDDLDGFLILKPQRRFIMEWNVQKDNGEDYQLVLFNDILMICKPKKGEKRKFKGKMLLHRVRVTNVSDSLHSVDISDISVDNQRQTFRMQNEADKKKFLSETTLAIQNVRLQLEDAKNLKWSQVPRTKCIALYENVATNTIPGENELEFSIGDVIYVTEKTMGRLWKGELSGKVGVFPWEFVRPINEDTVTTSDLVGCMISGDMGTLESYIATLPEEKQLPKREEVEYMFKQMMKEKGIESSNETGSRLRANTAPDLTTKNLKWEARVERSGQISPRLPDKKNRPPSSIKAVHVVHDQNVKYRKTMEDEEIIIDKFGGNPNTGYFAIYDGHGGRETVDYVIEHLHKEVLNQLKDSVEFPEALQKAYSEVDSRITLDKIAKNSGCTAITAVVTKNANGERWLYVANAGDARAVISHAGKAERLSFDHKSNDESEVERVRKCGGIVVNGRLGGFLAVSRAFGDTALKEFGLIVEPYQTATLLKPTDTHLILACDGLWDVCEDQEAVDLTKKLTAKTGCEKLMATALEKGSKDNITIMIVTL